MVEDRQRREITAERVALPRPGFVTGMNFDPRGNFLLIRARTGDSSEDLMVLDQVNLKLSAFVQNLAPEEKMARAFEVDGKGNLVYVDKEGQLRMAATGMGHINHGGLRLVVSVR